jgi:hypothetical protein
MTFSPSEAGPKVYPHATQMSVSWQRTRLRKIRKEHSCWLRKGSEVRTQRYLVLCEVMPRNSKIPSKERNQAAMKRSSYGDRVKIESLSIDKIDQGSLKTIQVHLSISDKSCFIKCILRLALTLFSAKSSLNGLTA